MNTAAKLGGFAAGLALAFAAAAGTGALIGPVRSAEPAPAGQGHADVHSQPSTAASPATTTTELPGGLMVSEDGYTLALDSPTASPGTRVPVRFRILGPDGQAQTAFETTHDKDLHLIVVRRDMTGFQHLHPALAQDGTWSAPVDLGPGQWRVFADFTPSGGPATVLGADLAVDGAYSTQPLPDPGGTAEVDGYEVRLDGALAPGAASQLTLSVTRDGHPVTDLQPYLGAYGHLVALREGDLAYLHVHPAGEIGDPATRPGPDIAFRATAPTAGTYRLFLDFQHDNVVHTAEFTARADTDAHVDDTGTDHSSAHSH